MATKKPTRSRKTASSTPATPSAPAEQQPAEQPGAAAAAVTEQGTEAPLTTAEATSAAAAQPRAAPAPVTDEPHPDKAVEAIDEAIDEAGAVLTPAGDGAAGLVEHVGPPSIDSVLGNLVPSCPGAVIMRSSTQLGGENAAL